MDIVTSSVIDNVIDGYEIDEVDDDDDDDEEEEEEDMRASNSISNTLKI